MERIPTELRHNIKNTTLDDMEVLSGDKHITPVMESS